jgi:VCBS repeat protein
MHCHPDGNSINELQTRHTIVSSIISSGVPLTLVSLISDRRPSRAAIIAIISLAAFISTLANPLAARVYAQTPAATVRNEVHEASAPASRGGASPGAPRWLKDDRQREYFVDRIPKNRAVRINQNTVRNFWGFPLDVVSEDDQCYYYKSYKPIVTPGTAPKPRVAADEKRKILRSYRAKTLTSDRLRFSAFGNGLPSSGQWREGFAIADMNGEGHPDLVLAPPRKTAQPLPVIFLGDGKGSWTKWRQASFPNLPYDYGDVQVGDFNHDGHPDIAFGVHLRGLIALVGDGKGGFTDAGQGLDFAVGGASPFSSTALRIVDWNGPGSQDILAFGEGPALAAEKSTTRAALCCTPTWAMANGRGASLRETASFSANRSQSAISSAMAIPALPPAPA